MRGVTTLQTTLAAARGAAELMDVCNVHYRSQLDDFRPAPPGGHFEQPHNGVTETLEHLPERVLAFLCGSPTRAGFYV